VIVLHCIIACEEDDMSERELSENQILEIL